MATRQYIPRPLIPENLATLTEAELNDLHTQTQLFVEQCRYYCNLACNEDPSYYQTAEDEQAHTEWEHRRVTQHIGL